MRNRLSLKTIGVEGIDTLQDFMAFLTNFPVEFKDIMMQLRQGKLHLKYELAEYEPIVNKAEQLTNRLILTLLIIALIIGSSIMMTAYWSSQTPFILGLPVWSFAGFSLAGFFIVNCIVADLAELSSLSFGCRFAKFLAGFRS